MFIKLVRIGKDAEVRSVNGKSVLNVNVAYDVGFGDKKETQWMRLALWGDRADKVASHMTKGKQIVVRVDDLKVRMFDGTNGKQATLEGTLIGFDFVSDGRRDDMPQESRQQDRAATVQQERARSTPASTDIDDDLPF